MGTEFQWERDGGDGCTTIRMYLIQLNYTLKMVKMINYIYIFFTTVKKI